MIWLLAGGYLVGVLLVGLTVLTLSAGRRRFSAIAVLPVAFGLGAGTLGLILFWFSLAGLRPSRPLVLAIFAFSAAVPAIRLGRRRLTDARQPPTDGKTVAAVAARKASVETATWKQSPANLLLGAVLVIPCAWVALETLSAPFSNIDAVAIWGLKAKVVAHEPVRESDYFYDVSKSFSHLDYPLLVPFVTAGEYALAGRVDDRLAKCISLWFFVMFVLLVVQAVKTVLTPRQTLLLAIVYVSIPTFLAQSASGIADIAVMFYYAGSAWFLISWAKTGNRVDLLAGAMFSACLAFTKNEGMALALVNVLVVGFWSAAGNRWRHLTALSIQPSASAKADRGSPDVSPDGGIDVVGAQSQQAAAGGKKAFRDFITYVAVVAGLNIPWLVFSAGIPRTHENYVGRLRFSTLMENVDRVPVVADAFTRAILDVGGWHALWVLLVVSVPAGHARVDRLRAGLFWLLLLVHLAIYFVIFIVTPWDVAQLLRIKGYPLLLQASPVVVFLIAEYWRGFAPKTSERLSDPSQTL